MFSFPHSAPLTHDSGAREGITTDSSDSTTLWIGSKVRQRTLHDVPRLVADRIATSARISTVYVFNYEPIIYYLADAPPPTRYVLLPADITARELIAEVRRIMSLRPSHIVVTDSPVFFHPPEVQDIVEGELAKIYELDSKFIDSMTAEHVRLYRFR
jgi:hypothetical protein